MTVSSASATRRRTSWGATAAVTAPGRFPFGALRQDLHELEAVQVGEGPQVDALVVAPRVLDARHAADRDVRRVERAEAIRARARAGRDHGLPRVDAVLAPGVVHEQVVGPPRLRGHPAVHARRLVDAGRDVGRVVGDERDDRGRAGREGHAADEPLARDDGLVDPQAVPGALVDRHRAPPDRGVLADDAGGHRAGGLQAQRLVEAQERREPGVLPHGGGAGHRLAAVACRAACAGRRAGPWRRRCPRPSRRGRARASAPGRRPPGRARRPTTTPRWTPPSAPPPPKEAVRRTREPATSSASTARRRRTVLSYTGSRGGRGFGGAGRA